MTIYDLTQEQLMLNDLLLESGGEITPEIEALLTINRDNLETKIDSYCKAIKTIEAQESFAKAEIERLTKIAKSCSNSVKRMKESMLNALNIFELAMVDVGTFKVSIRSSSAIAIDDNATIPDDYYVVKKEVSKTLLKEAIKEGKEIEGVSIVTNQSIQIR